MYFLGVDGGGTKTAFLLINEEGSILAEESKPSCAYLQVGFDNYKAVMEQGIWGICKKTGIKIRDIDFSCFGVPGYGEIDKDIPTLESIVKDILKNDRFVCVNDCEVGWAGSLACQAGINLVAGTGTIGFGKDQQGNKVRSSGWGEFCGDEGSAYWLGKKLIELFTKQSDGRMERTMLYNIVKQKFNLKRDFDFIDILYNKFKLRRSDIAKLQILLCDAAEQGDENAIRAYQDAAYELALVVKAITNSLNFDSSEKIKVSYSGGVFKAGELILNPLKECICDENVILIKPILKPVTGAALIALHRVKNIIDRKVIDKLKTS